MAIPLLALARRGLLGLSSEPDGVRFANARQFDFVHIQIIERMGALQSSDLISSRLQANRLAGVSLNNLFNLFGFGLFGGSGDFLPLIIRVRRRVLARRQINGSRGEIDREGDDTGNEKEQQANGIERDDLQIERPGRLTSPFRPEDRPAAGLLDSHQRNGQPLASR
jgi:hypothetical protein